MGDTLPPLPEAAFDGEKETAEIITATCTHKQAVLDISKRTIHCPCGAGWEGFGVEQLHKAMTD